MEWAINAVIIPAAVAVLAVIGGLAVLQVIHLVLRRFSRRSVALAELADHAHRPSQLLVAAIALEITLRAAHLDAGWRPPVTHVLNLVLIAGIAWLVAALLLVIEDLALSRYRTDVPDNRQARRVHTQVVMVRRFTAVIITVIAIGTMLITFPQARAMGTSLLASAGVAGVVAGLAAQTLLGNVFAGLQLAFSDALRLGDVVVVENEWGRVEEMTLTYVVVQVWDDRRLIMPTTYFTTRPFQNWTRTEAAVLGTVEVDVDWSLPVERMRTELRAFLEGTAAQLWDQRVCVLQVTESRGQMMTVRALVSAVDAPTLWDLRCLVREHLIGWVRDRYPTGMPRLRAEVADDDHSTGWRWVPQRLQTVRPGEPSDDSRVFGGSDDGDERAQTFSNTGEIPVVRVEENPLVRT